MPQIEEVAEGVYQIVLPTPFPVGPVNVYLIKGERLTLVDTGPKTKEAWDELVGALNLIDLSVEDIEQVILTHHHPDHVGNLDYLHKDIDVIGHWRNRPWITQDQEFIVHYERFFTEWLKNQGYSDVHIELFFDQVKKPMIFSCNRDLTSTIQEEDWVRGISEWKVVEVPGHAMSQIMLYREKDGVTIGGDHIIGHISSNPLIEPPYKGEQDRSRSMLQYNDSLRKCLDFDISVVLSGHGRIVRHTHSLIKRRLKRQDERALRILEWLKEKPMTGFEVCKELFPAVYEKQISLTTSEAIGQLDYLEDLMLITINKEDDVWKYSAK